MCGRDAIVWNVTESKQMKLFTWFYCHPPLLLIVKHPEYPYLLHVTPPLICIKRLESTALNGIIELS